MAKTKSDAAPADKEASKPTCWIEVTEYGPEGLIKRTVSQRVSREVVAKGAEVCLQAVAAIDQEAAKPTA